MFMEGAHQRVTEQMLWTLGQGESVAGPSSCDKTGLEELKAEPPA